MHYKEQHIWVPSVTLQSICKTSKQKTVHFAVPICGHEQHTKTYSTGTGGHRTAVYWSATATIRDGGSPNSCVLKCDRHNQGRRVPEQLCTEVRPPQFSWTLIPRNQISKESRSSDSRWHTLPMALWTISLEIWGNAQIRTANMHQDTTFLLNWKDRFGTLVGKDDHVEANYTLLTLSNVIWRNSRFWKAMILVTSFIHWATK